MRLGNTLLAGIAAVCLLAVGAALVFQYQFDKQPCPWCILQRLEFLAIAAVALLGLTARALRKPAALGIVLLAAAGVATSLWQHFVAAASESCKLTLAERIVAATRLDEWMPSVFAAYASCRDAAATLLGLPFEFYAMALFIAIGAAVVTSMRR